MIIEVMVMVTVVMVNACRGTPICIPNEDQTQTKWRQTQNGPKLGPPPAGSTPAPHLLRPGSKNWIPAAPDHRHHHHHHHLNCQHHHPHQHHHQNQMSNTFYELDVHKHLNFSNACSMAFCCQHRPNHARRDGGGPQPKSFNP